MHYTENKQFTSGFTVDAKWWLIMNFFSANRWFYVFNKDDSVRVDEQTVYIIIIKDNIFEYACQHS